MNTVHFFAPRLKIMATIPRRQKIKEDIRSRILEEAKRLFFEKGYDHASIRNIAEHIEYSVGTIYLHFKDKDSIFHALQGQGFAMLLEKMQVLESVHHPFERLKAMGSVYLDFAKKNPEFYDLMFIIRAPMNCLEDNEGWQGGMKTFGYLINIVKECQALGQFFLHKDPETLAFTIWSAVHGIAALKIRGRCRVITEEKQEDIDIKSYQDLLLMLSKN
jgi:AcrR family transcriptional regulator